jgi:hypothetical protein
MAWTSHAFRQTRQHRFSAQQKQTSRTEQYPRAWAIRHYKPGNPGLSPHGRTIPPADMGQKSYLVVYLSGPLKVRFRQSAGLSDYSLTLV